MMYIFSERKVVFETLLAHFVLTKRIQHIKSTENKAATEKEKSELIVIVSFIQNSHIRQNQTAPNVTTSHGCSSKIQLHRALSINDLKNDVKF